jgi:hypothetical protein
MSSLAWIGIIVWGIFVTGCGLGMLGMADAPPQDVAFLLAGGLLTCLLGAVGLLGFMAWIPGLRGEQKSYS